MSLEGFNIDVRDLVNVVRSGNIELFFEYYLNLKNLINPSNGLSLLHEAVRGGDLTKVRYLLDEGAYILSLDQYGRTPAERAILRGNLEMVACFLEKISVNYIFPSGNTLLTGCLQRYSNNRASDEEVERQMNEVGWLISKGANPFLGEHHAFYHLVTYYQKFPEGSSPGIAKRNELIRQILFPKSDREMVIPDEINKKEFFLLILSNPRIPHRITNWMKFNQETVRSWLTDNSGMSIAEMIFLDPLYGISNYQSVVHLIKKGFLTGINGLSDRAKQLIKREQNHYFGELSEEEKLPEPTNLLMGVLQMNSIYTRRNIWTLDNTFNLIRELVKLLTQEMSPNELGDMISGLIPMMIVIYKIYFNKHMQSEARRGANLIKNRLIPELTKRGIDRIENSTFGCCRLLNYCCLYQKLNPVSEMILKGLKKEDLDQSCSGWEMCQTPLRAALQNGNYEILPHLLMAGADHSPIVGLIHRGELSLQIFKMLFNSMIEKGNIPISWDDIPLIYRFSLNGSILKKLDSLDNQVFKLVTREDPIIGDDLQEIESDRLVIVNHVPWDIENLVQYVTKVVRGENKFDTKHPMAGRPIWIGMGYYRDHWNRPSDELGCLYHSTISIPEESRARVTNLRQEYERESERESDRESDRRNIATIDTEGEMMSRLGIRPNENHITYGELLKSYLEIGGLLSQINRSDFEELYRIGSILWARGDFWDKAIHEKLSDSEYQTWRTNYQKKLNFDEMPYGMDESIRRKLKDIKLTQLANLDIWYQRVKKLPSSLTNISRICYSGQEEECLERVISLVLRAEYCVMSFGSTICSGYLKAKIIWDREA